MMTLIGWFVLAACGVGLVAYGLRGFLSVWRESEAQTQAKREDSRRQSMQAAMDVTEWPRPAGVHRTPWKSNRKEIAS